MTLLGSKGYRVYPRVVPEELCRAVVADIILHTDNGNYMTDPNGLVEMYHYQSMWNVRQHPSIHEVFAALFGTEKLWVSIDRCCYKKVAGELDSVGSFIHWDENPNVRPRPLLFQGLVALTDTDESMGGFQCLPSLYQELDAFLDSQPTRKYCYPYLNAGENGLAYECVPYEYRGGMNQELVPIRQGRTFPIEKVPMQQGDLLIWDSYLPHGNGINRGTAPRLALYLTMFPAGDARLREERINCWAKNATPSAWAFPGDPRNLELKRCDFARLTPHGCRLLGLGNWDLKYE